MFRSSILKKCTIVVTNAGYYSVNDITTILGQLLRLNIIFLVCYLFVRHSQFEACLTNSHEKTLVSINFDIYQNNVMVN